MSILVAVPTRGRIWFETAMSLAELAGEDEVGDILYLQNTRSVLEARNEIVKSFLETEHDVLLMIDDDVVPHPDILDLATRLQGTLGVGIVGAPVPITRPGLPVVPNLYSISDDEKSFAIDMSSMLTEGNIYVPVDAIGFGAVALSRSLVKAQPTFENRYDEEGVIYMGEDVDYCLRARKQGYSTYAAMDLLCDHRTDIHLGAVATTLSNFLVNEI